MKKIEHRECFNSKDSPSLDGQQGVEHRECFNSKDSPSLDGQQGVEHKENSFQEFFSIATSKKMEEVAK